MSDEGPEVVVRVTSDTTQATQGAQQLGANWDKVGEMGFRAAGRLTSGIGGLLSMQNNIYNAQMRVNVAQINYTLTVRQYGEGSIQAARALDQLNIAQRGVALAQDQMDLKMLSFAFTTGPQVYSSIIKMMAASQGMTVANYMETASWYAKAAAITATAVAMAAATFGISALIGGLGVGAVQSQAVNQNISQNNSFYGQVPPATNLSYANQQLAIGVKSAVRP